MSYVDAPLRGVSFTKHPFSTFNQDAISSYFPRNKMVELILFPIDDLHNFIIHHLQPRRWGKLLASTRRKLLGENRAVKENAELSF